MRRTHSVLVVAAFALFGVNCRVAYGQNCVMTPEYSLYVNATGTGGDITTYVQVYGYAQVEPPDCGNGTYTHTGAAYNLISNAGGWEYGTPTCPSCYIDVENNQNLSGTAGSTYPFKFEVRVTCSRAGIIYDNYGSEQVTLPSIRGPDTLWYFNTQNPSGYATSITLTANMDVGWQVTSGNDRISLSTNSGTTTNITPTGEHFSGALMDTCVMVTTSGFSSAPFCLTVRTPWELVPDGTVTTVPWPGYGYRSSIAYYVYDNLYVQLPHDAGWNEILGPATEPPGSNWATCCGTITPGGAPSTSPLVDYLVPPGLNNSPPPSPTPTYNNPPNGQTPYREIPQTIYVGTTGPGVGTLVQSDALTYFIDHGSHTGIQSPAKPPQ
jgi:hypothetical protein